MTTLTTYAQLIEDAISVYELPTRPANLYEPLRYFLKLGGKRMRPMLTLMAAKANGVGVEKAMPAALAVELFHNFSLIHDDIMDAAPLRRSQATVHEKWNANIAILSGDVLLVKAYEQLATYQEGPLVKLLHLFNKTAIEVCEGQQMDMDFETQTEVSAAAYLEMIRLKTSVLVGCALQMGALIGGANDALAAQYYTFGEQLGLAFQIQDDLLDAYGDPSKVGKQVGGDILANKKTLLSITAFEQANEVQRKQLFKLQTVTHPSQKVADTLSLFEQLQVARLCKIKMQQHQELAMKALDQIERVQDQRELRALADFLFERNH
ncbi:MAG: hypothetical protein RLZZ301_580 [Bacteroidota bacterium]|jgi:geranylgeranyl diphosphate synthase type II